MQSEIKLWNMAAFSMTVCLGYTVSNNTQALKGKVNFLNQYQFTWEAQLGHNNSNPTSGIHGFAMSSYYNNVLKTIYSRTISVTVQY